MDFNDIFRSFFGFHGPKSFGNMEDDSEGSDFFRSPPPFGFHGGQSGDDDTEEDATFGRGHGGWFPPSSGGPFFKFDQDMQDMFGHFEEMFRNFGLSGEPSSSAFSQIDEEPLALPPSPPSSSRRQTPRDEMLKHPDSHQPATPPPNREPDRLKPEPDRKPSRELPSWSSLWNSKSKWNFPMPFPPSTTPHKKDQDLDDQVKGGKLGEILTQREPSLKPDTDIRQNPSSRSYFRSISVQTVHKPDGTVEQRRTETDADGNVTTTVRSTNPKAPRVPSCLPSPCRPPGCGKADLEEDNALLGRAKSKSIFDKIFASWGRP